MATMDDIAKKLGTTKGTVSKALSGAEDISETMRKAVLEAAVELGYNRVNRASHKPKICVFIENISYANPDDFGWGLITGFRKMAEPAGYAVDIVDLTNTLQKSIHYDTYMLQHNYKGGFFLGTTLSDPWLTDFATCRTPTVLYDNHPQYNPNVSAVSIDNDEGMEIAISTLQKQGHKTIGYLSGALGAYVFQQRYMAFFHALRKHGMNDDRKLAGHPYHTAECLESDLPRLLELGCTAIICSHDLLAHAVLIHCKEIGVRIPEDLSIIGIDDLPICRYTDPPLSSIRQDRNELGKSAFHALSSQIEQVHLNTLKLHPELVLRGSVGSAPKLKNF